MPKTEFEGNELIRKVENSKALQFWLFEIRGGLLMTDCLDVAQIRKANRASQSN